MSEAAFDPLLPLIRNHRSPAVWFADENALDLAAALPGAREGLVIASNRFDIHRQFSAAGCDSRFFDFEAGVCGDGRVQQVFYRISKEKPVTHHIINLAFQLLEPGGELVLCGEKGEGVKSYFNKAKTLFNSDARLEKNGRIYLARLERVSGPAGDRWLDDKDYHRLRPVAEQNQTPFYSKPGIFGWDKIDRGSAFLAGHLPAFLQRFAERNQALPDSLLDLGCGYGYLMAMGAAALRDATAATDTQTRPPRLVATDNNAAALIAARHNFHRQALAVEVVADDGGSGIEGQFDLILCNPPFHQGFSIDAGLTDKFLRQTRRLLSPRGGALFVVNRFIPLERKAEDYFGRIEIEADNKGFKLIGVASQ